MTELILNEVYKRGHWRKLGDGWKQRVSWKIQKKRDDALPDRHAICYTYEHYKLGSRRITSTVNILPDVAC